MWQRALALLARAWRILSRPSVHLSLGFLTIGGFIAGVVFWGAFNTALELTNTETFCTSWRANNSFAGRRVPFPRAPEFPEPRHRLSPPKHPAPSNHTIRSNPPARVSPKQKRRIPARCASIPRPPAVAGGPQRSAPRPGNPRPQPLVWRSAESSMHSGPGNHRSLIELSATKAHTMERM